MRTVAPLSRACEAENIIKAGADELYCGVYTEDWRKRYTDIAAPNRHPGRSANLGDFKELSRVVSLAHSYNTPVSFTINEFYSDRQYESAMDNVEEAVDAGVDALIVADINLLLMIRERAYNIKIHMGTEGTTFNSQTVAFYKDLGVSRVILDRHLTIEEIGGIAAGSADMELEVFVLNQKCHNIDGFCTFAHGLMATKYPFLSRLWNTKPVKRLINLYPGDTSGIEESIFRKELGCCLDYEISGGIPGIEPEKRNEFSRLFDPVNFLKRCGACALYDLNKFKVGFVKIVGREDFSAKKIRDVGFIHNAIELLKDNSGREAFAERAKELYKIINYSNCRAGFCYYPG